MVLDVTFTSETLEGQVRDLSQAHGVLALAALAQGGAKLILSGGETSLTLGPTQDGRGGRNLEYLVAFAITLDGANGIYALACDSNGIDGSSYATGAVITPCTLARAQQRGLDATTCLSAHQSHAFFEALGDLIVTGSTRTNVNDFRAILIS